MSPPAPLLDPPLVLPSFSRIHHRLTVSPLFSFFRSIFRRARPWPALFFEFSGHPAPAAGPVRRHPTGPHPTPWLCAPPSDRAPAPSSSGRVLPCAGSSGRRPPAEWTLPRPMSPWATVRPRTTAGQPGWPSPSSPCEQQLPRPRTYTGRMTTYVNRQEEDNQGRR